MYRFSLTKILYQRETQNVPFFSDEGPLSERNIECTVFLTKALYQRETQNVPFPSDEGPLSEGITATFYISICTSGSYIVDCFVELDVETDSNDTSCEMNLLNVVSITTMYGAQS